MSNKIKIDLFSDPACPWCLVGLTRFDQALQRLDPNVELELTHHAYLLDPNTPEGGENARDVLQMKYGQAPDEMWDRLEEEGKKSGLDLDMRKQEIRYPTQRAQILIAIAKEQDKQQEIALALSRANYLKAENISDPDFLADLAEAHGFDREEIFALVQREDLKGHIEKAAADASKQGVQGVPFFIFNEQYAMSGAQPDEVFDQVFAQLLSGEPMPQPDQPA